MASDIFTRKIRANTKNREKCGMRKCAKEVKVHNELNLVVKKEVAKKCGNIDKTHKKYGDCASKMKPMNKTKKRTGVEFVKDYKEWLKKLTKKCDPEKEFEKSNKCSGKIYKESGYGKALIDLVDCKVKKC